MTDDPDDLVDDEPDYGPAGRPAAPRTTKIKQRPSLPAVERTLDSFIEQAKAAPHAHDVSYFDPGTREQTMREQIEALERKLADAEAREGAAQRAADTARRDANARRDADAPGDGSVRAAPSDRAKPRWRALVLAFTIGGASVFAATSLWPRADRASEPQNEIVKPASSPKQQPDKVPAETATKEFGQEAGTNAVDEPSKQAVAEPRPGRVAAVAKPRPRPTKAADLRSAISKPVASKPADPTSADLKPADSRPTDSGLYNPFGKP